MSVEDINANDNAHIRRAIVRIKVFGIGGAGNNVLKRLSSNHFAETDLIAINTDSNVLSLSDGNIKGIQIGGALTNGRGTGGKVALGEQAAKLDSDRLKNMMSGSDMIFITAGMGGGTGTGAAPIVAKIAKELGLLTVGVVTVPFSFEGKLKQRKATEGIIKMQSYMDALIVVKNDNLMKLPENRALTIENAFRAADSVLIQAIRCIVELILTTGIVNVDFADVTTIFQQSESSDALLGIGRSNVSAVKAVQQAIESPLNERSLEGARGIILNITGDENLSLYDVNEAAGFIFNMTPDDVNIILGVVNDNSLNGTIQATIIATNFIDSLAMKSPRIEVPKSTATISRGFNLEMPKFPNRGGEKNNIISAFQFFGSQDNKDK
ncbi:MAG: cell division protein FtsZ [Selenomonadaceae bacterium]|nr:cell division protein FtsZ [Selenomonadaceae bacterium]